MKPEANKPSRIPRAHEQKPALPSNSLADATQVFQDILDLHQGPGVYLVLALSGEARQRLMARWQDLAAPRSQQARQSLQSLNLARERLRQLPAPLFFWMSPEVLRAFARYAADLFAVRSGLLDVLGSPPARARATASDIERPEPKIPWLTHYGHLSREEREGRLRLLLEALEREARRSQPNLYRLAHYHLDAAELLGSLEQYERALHHAQQALALARKVNDPALQAASWLAIGQGLAALGRYDEALRAIQQAVDLYRDLAAQNPRAFRPDLARALLNLGAMLSALGRPEEALAAAREAVDLYRDLAAQNLSQAFRDIEARAYTLAGLAPHLPEDLLVEALEAARGIASEWRRADALAALAPHLPKELRAQALAEALAAARAIEEAEARAKALTALASHLPKDLREQVLAEALDAARTIELEQYRAEALAALAPKLAEAGYPAEALAAARGIEEAEARAKALAALAPHLPEGLREQLLAEALAAARAIEEAEARAKALAVLAPHLPEGLLAEALNAVREIRDERYRARALAALAPYLPKESRLQRPDDEETRTTDAYRRERKNTDLSGS